MDSIQGFTKKYKVHRLVYYETFDHVQNAIRRRVPHASPFPVPYKTVGAPSFASNTSHRAFMCETDAKGGLIEMPARHLRTPTRAKCQGPASAEP